MTDTRYHIEGGSMAAALTTMNNHMAEADQHVTTAEKELYSAPTWASITGVPLLASSLWRAPVSTPAGLPTSSNTIGDVRVVTNDGDAKQAIYVCKAVSGATYTDCWTKIADVDWGVPAWTAITGKPSIILADGSVAMTALLTLAATVPTGANHAASKSYVDSQSMINAIIFG